MSGASRAAFITALVGCPWVADGRSGGYNCYTLVAHVSQHLFGRVLPDVVPPRPLTWRAMMDGIARHPERSLWSERPFEGVLPPNLQDGALVLMARSTLPAHLGVWLAGEQGVLHCDEGLGVVFETPVFLAARSWKRLLFLEPRVDFGMNP